MICDKLKDICDKFFQKLTDIVPLFLTTACRAEAYTNINIQIIYNEKYIT
jgi:hypothetical protein